MSKVHGAVWPCANCHRAFLTFCFFFVKEKEGMKITLNNLTSSLHFFACPKKRSKESAPRTPTLAAISHKAALLGPSLLQFAPFVDACPGIR